MPPITRRAQRQATKATGQSAGGQTNQTVPVATTADNAPDEQRPWTPLPQQSDQLIYAEWGRKHYGQDWYELREKMLRERNVYIEDARKDIVFLMRQCALRRMEREREEGKLHLENGKTWAELVAWMRWHYGERWYKQWEIVARFLEEAKEDKTLSVQEYLKRRRKIRKIESRVHEMQLARDEEMLAQGATWDDIMAWPPVTEQYINASETGPPTPPSLYEIDSISDSDSDRGSMLSTYPPTPTDTTRLARGGPGYFTPSSHDFWTNESGWGHVEFQAAQDFMLKKPYMRHKMEHVEHLRFLRSLQEVHEAKERDRKEDGDLMRASTDGIMNFMEARERRIVYHQEREEANRQRDAQQNLWLQELVSSPPQSQEQMDQRFDLWEIQGLSRDEGNCLARMYRFPERPPLFLFEDSDLEWPTQRLGESLRPPVDSFFYGGWYKHYPRTKEGMLQRFRHFENALNRAEKNALARMYKLGEWPASEAGEDKPGTQPEKEKEQEQERPASPIRDASRKTLGGRIAKSKSSTEQARRGGQPSTKRARPKSQPKASRGERSSRRLAHLPPEYDVPLSGEASLSKTRQTRSVGALPPTPPRTASKPQGVTKSEKKQPPKTSSKPQGVTKSGKRQSAPPRRASRAGKQ